jgi:3',5'-cyclic AMP phosphodiesterase CpdA
VTDARLLHLSDTHLLAGGVLHQGLVDTTALLRNVLDGLSALGPLDAVVVSGDVSDDGSPESYEAASKLVGGFAARRGAQVVWAVGNHDVRDSFAQTLLGRPDGAGGQPLDTVLDVGGLRIVALDSSVPGRGYGELRPGQLSLLREVLAQPAARGASSWCTTRRCPHPRFSTTRCACRSRRRSWPRCRARTCVRCSAGTTTTRTWPPSAT